MTFGRFVPILFVLFALLHYLAALCLGPAAEGLGSGLS